MNGRVLIVNAASMVAILSLAVGLLAAGLAYSGTWSFETYKLVLNLASLAWFVSAPLWFIPHRFGAKFAEAGKKAWLRGKE
jgi:hypothetical protein